MQLSLAAARTLLVAAQGLDRRPDHPVTKDDALAAIRRMGALQIDTIHVVARSPYLVLWSRLGNYQPQWLDELLEEGKLFEYWAHAASFLPIEDYPLYRRRMLDGETMGWANLPQWITAHAEAVEHLRGHIRANGAVRSSDFERTDGQQGGWWNWKPEKEALEVLHTTGELMIVKRHNFQRVYDLRERVLPGWDDSQAPAFEQVKREQVLRTVRALGVTIGAWVPDYFRFRKIGMDKLLAQLVDEGALLRAEIEGLKSPAYIHPDNAELAADAVAGRLQPTLTTFLTPFDPLVWDRARDRALFNFDYSIECYTPEPKRRYGYFSLPILRRGVLIGRLDAKAHRKEGIFEVKAFHLEPGVVPDAGLIADVAGALRECADWHKTPQVVVRHSDPEGVARLLNEATQAEISTENTESTETETETIAQRRKERKGAKK